MTAEIIYGSKKHELCNTFSYSFFHIKITTPKYRHGIRRVWNDEKGIIINMMCISEYICRKTRITIKIVAREEKTVKVCIHKT